MHPFLHRTLSLREFARAQSFPDSYKIDLEDLEKYSLKDAIRIFGNAVPVNLGTAIFGELLMPLMRKYEEEMKDRQSATSLKRPLATSGHKRSTGSTSAKVGQTAGEKLENPVYGKGYGKLNQKGWKESKYGYKEY